MTNVRPLMLFLAPPLGAVGRAAAAGVCIILLLGLDDDGHDVISVSPSAHC